MTRPYTYSTSRYTNYLYGSSSHSPQIYPQDIECVYPSSDPTKGSIYVSNVEAASNHLTLLKHNIKAVMTCAKGYDRNIPKSKLDMFQYFPFDDKQSCQISPYFEKATNFIVAALEKTNVLVHCIAGVSRSVSMVLAYLIKQKSMSYEQAYRVVKSRRKIISPNDGFIRQLKQYALQIRQSMERPQSKTPQKIQTNLSKASFTQFKQANRQKFQNDSTLKKSQTFIKNASSPQNQQQISSQNIRKQGHKQNYFNLRNSLNDYSFKNIRNASLYIPKTSTLQFQTSKTPQKIKNIQNQKSIFQDSKSKSNYYHRMNEQLNQKIQAIHAKYEKQRQNLLSKRGFNHGTNRNNSIYSQTYKMNLLGTQKDINDKSNYVKYTDMMVNRGINNKYYDMYQNKYSRGLTYTGFGKTNFSRNRFM